MNVPKHLFSLYPFSFASLSLSLPLSTLFVSLSFYLFLTLSVCASLFFVSYFLLSLPLTQLSHCPRTGIVRPPTGILSKSSFDFFPLTTPTPLYIFFCPQLSFDPLQSISTRARSEARTSTWWKQEDPLKHRALTGAGKYGSTVETGGSAVVYKLSEYPHPFIHPPLYFLTLTPDLKLSSSYMLYLVVIVCCLADLGLGTFSF